MTPNKKRTHGSSSRKHAAKKTHVEDPAQLVAKADTRVLKLLTELGSKIEKPHEVSFWIYIPVEEQAYSAAAELAKQGFEVEVSPPFDGRDEWLCLAYKHFVPRFATIERFRKQLTDLAERYGGKFDGWEMKVEK